MKSLLLKLSFLAIGVLSTLNLSATHLLGSELTYEKIANSSNSYRFKLVLYLDPSGISAPTSTTLEFDDNTPSVTVTQFSARYQKITCNDSIEIVTYLSNSVFVPYAPPGKLIYWQNCCRSPQLTNVQAPDSNFIFIFARLRNSPNRTDYGSSPQFQSFGSYAIPAIGTSRISFTADDLEADSLYYSFVDARTWINNAGAPMSYVANHSSTAPFDSSTATSLNHRSGILSVTNPSVGSYAVSVKVEAYKDGWLTSRVFRDVTIKVVPGAVNTYGLDFSVNQNSPAKAAAVSSGKTLSLDVFEGQLISFDLKAKALVPPSAPSPNVKLSAVALRADTAAGGNCISSNCAQLSGNLSALDSADGVFQYIVPQLPQNDSVHHMSFVLKAEVEDWCGSTFEENYVVILRARKSTVGTNTNNFYRCVDDTLQAVITGDVSNLIWVPSYGVSNPTSATPMLYPDSTVLYTIYNLNDSNSTNVFVEVSPFAGNNSTLVENSGVISLGNQNTANLTWYYNGFAVSKNAEIDGVSGYFRAEADSAGCKQESNLLKFEQANQSGLVLDSATFLSPLAQTHEHEFTIESLESNQLSKIYVMLRKDMVINDVWNYQIIDDASTILMAGKSLLDAKNNRLVLLHNAAPLNFPSGTKLKVYIFKSGSGSIINDFAFIPTPILPLIDERSTLKLTNPRTFHGQAFTLNNTAVLPMVFEYTNAISLEENNSLNNEISVFPNPTTGLINIIGQTEQIKLVSLYSINGTLIELDCLNHAKGNQILLPENLPNGVYIIKIGLVNGYQIQRVNLMK